MLTAAIIFGLTYLVIAVERLPGLRLDRPSGALLGAVAMVAAGVIDFEAALAAIDLDTLLFLLGMMILLAHLELSGFFAVLERQVLMLAHSRSSLLVLTVLCSGTLSAVFMNDTICLMFTPVLLRVTRRLELDPVPYLIGLAAGANAGSVATILGNPQNAYIAVRSGIGLVEFSARVWPIALAALAITATVLRIRYREQLLGAPLTVPPPREPEPRSVPLMLAALGAGGVMILAMAFGVRPAAAAMLGAALVILAGARRERQALARVDWQLLLFFAGLFVVMRGVREAGFAQSLLADVTGPVGGATGPLGLARLAAAVTALSQAVSNVPAVMLFAPALEQLPAPDARAIDLALAVFSTLAGNLTVIGSMANVIVFERARRDGFEVSFGEYLRSGLPITLLTLAAAWVWLAFTS